MLKNHEKYHSRNGRRTVLIVDDELINRELLKLALEEDYETLTAADGDTALEIIRESAGTLALVLLDLLMPGMHGLDLIRAIRDDPKLMHIPVIVLTSDKKAEVQSLQMGAVDFISKPYPEREVILARVRRTIELSEDRDIIEFTERDNLTGLYNREYFYRYAQQLDRHHPGCDMDAIVVDIHHFRMINERYGKAFGDDVLRRIGEKLMETVGDSDGIVCRREADTFLIYCPHRDDYPTILERASIGLTGDDASANRVRLRMGVYPGVDKGIEMERRFDRAKMAADTVRSNYVNSIALYDNALHESEIYAERLLEDFQTAITQKQFRVFFQPKFDIRPDVPVLASAEALVRWIHPELGFINPGKFIPLFEENGLIQQLDLYVWREAAAHIREWKDRLGLCVPVSVNVSRIDMYDPNLVDTFRGLLREFDLTADELLLEITESAYTQDYQQIISKVNHLRDMGFHIEMDDFGTGYSSLNMISSLPIDALKLDMTFIRNAFRDGGDTRLIEVIIDIADYLAVPVIAEGVETEAQLNTLKAMGCDLVQGYYFSRPVPAPEYEAFLIEKKRRLAEEGERSVEDWVEQEIRPEERAMPNTIARALTSGFEVIYYVDIQSGRYVEFSARGRYEDLKIERSGADFFADCQRNIDRVVFGEDRERMSASLRREALLSRLAGGQPFAMTYRLMINDEPVYHSLRAVRAVTRDDHHIVIGVSDVQDQIRQASGAPVCTDRERAHECFSIAQTLSSDFEHIYYVDTLTESYTEFTAQGACEEPKIELRGVGFFDECQKNLRAVVYFEDQPRVSELLLKGNLLKAVAGGQSSSIVYRLIIDGAPTWHRMKIVMAEDQRHIVIGVSNVASEIARDREYQASHADRMTCGRIAQALSADYFLICYVNVETGHFVEYRPRSSIRELTGEAFFAECRRAISGRVLPEDQPRLLAAFERAALLREMGEDGTFSMDCQLILDGKPCRAGIKAIRLPDDPEHIVIGVNKVKAPVKRQAGSDAPRAESDILARIAQALSREYFSVYLVDIDTDAFVEYASGGEDGKLLEAQKGVNFFRDCRKNVLRLVYREDLEKALAVWDKKRLMPRLEDGKTFSTTYRLMIDGVPTYISCKIIRMDAQRIVVAISNVDEQMKRERELTAIRERANRDALTGVKSKHAYLDAVAGINIAIDTGSAKPFSVVVCDVNGLKRVNDTQGREAGDRLIREASAMICNTFKHSPVYRVGGDEFVVILRGADYERRAELMAEIASRSRVNRQTGGVVFACGDSEWHSGEDDRFEVVFDRADNAMYENKIALKARE